MRWNVCLAFAAVIGVNWLETAEACQKCRRSRCCCVRMAPVCRPGNAAAAGAAVAANGGAGLADDINVGGVPAAAAGGAAGSIGDDINPNLGAGGAAAGATLPAWAEENYKLMAMTQDRRLAKSAQVLDLRRNNLLAGNAPTLVARTPELMKEIKDSWGF